MSAPTIKCHKGHLNSAIQKYCGECGLPLVGICPNGHPNPKGQRYCGECGSQLGQTDTSKSHTIPPAGNQVASESSSPSTNQAQADAPRATFQIGDELMLPDGIYARVAKFDDETVWLDITKGQSSFGTSKFPRRDVEKSLAEKRMAVVDRSALASDALHGDVISTQATNSALRPPQMNETVTTNVFSIIAFVCGGLALFGGVTLIALPTIFGVAAIICAVVALTKKERLAPYAIGAAVGGLILGWLLQVAVFNSVFS